MSAISRNLFKLNTKLVSLSSSHLIRRSVATNYKTNTYKSTTGLVGLAVDYDARNTLLDLTAKCLQSVQVSSLPSYFVIYDNILESTS